MAVGDKVVEKTIMDTIMSSLASGARELGLKGLATELGKGGLSGLYGGLDALAGGLLPFGQDISAGYLGRLYTGADKLAGGYLPNLGISTYTSPAQAAANTAANLGGQIVPAGSTVPAATAPAPSAFRSGVNNFLSYAKPAVGLASAIGGIASILDGGGGGRNVPTAAKGGRNVTPGTGYGGSYRNMTPPQGDTGSTKSPLGATLGQNIASALNRTESSDKTAVTPGEGKSGDLGETKAAEDIEVIAGGTPEEAAELVGKGVGELMSTVDSTTDTLTEQQEMEEETIRQDAIQQAVFPVAGIAQENY